jgi:hypothetical protein
MSTTLEQVIETEGTMLVRTGTARATINASGRTEQSVPFLPGVIVALSVPLYPG